jgi:hypothetical protein
VAAGNATGYELANDGHDARAIQQHLLHLGSLLVYRLPFAWPIPVCRPHLLECAMHCIQCFVWCFFGPRIIVTPIVDVTAAPTNRLAGLAEPPKPNQVLSDPVQTVFECQLLGHDTMVIPSQRAHRLAAKPGQQKQPDRCATDAN